MRRSGRPLPAALLASLLLAAGACAAGESGSDVVVVDSAGIAIVQNEADPAALPLLELAAEPLVDIGRVDGPPEYQLFRVMDGIRLDDGRLALLNAGSQQLRFYDPDGRFLAAQGRSGEGPGEYRFPYRVHGLPGDSLMIYDIGMARFTVVGPSGEAVRTFTPSRAIINEPSLAGLIGDSIAVLHETIYVIPHTGFDTMRTRVAFVDLAGGGTDSLMVPDARMGTIGHRGGRGFVGRPHFEPTTSLTTAGGGLWVGTARRPEIVRYGADGRLTRLVRWAAEPTQVTPEDVARVVETRVGDAGDRAAELRTMYRDVPAAETFPFYDEMLTDRQGRIWVREYDTTGEAATRRWLVFDDEGRLTARAVLPANLRILEIDADYLLGVQLDELDVEHVRLWELEGPSTEDRLSALGLGLTRGHHNPIPGRRLHVHGVALNP